ncbi:MAG TPA: aldo/keto reductase [Candidatus Binataceae bacterium]|nr:aldo/keto reductase [Candidatus Binataceae bacterium]
MELKELGATGTMVPEIGIGVWRYGGGVAPLRKAIDLGASLIDTAEIYGTEGVVGEAIKAIRDRVFIASKVAGNHLRHDEVLKAAEASLKRMEISCIDLYQIHWPAGHVPIAETMRAMELLADRGMIKYIGVSNFSPAELREALAAMNHHPIVSNQVIYSLNRRGIESELVPFCAQNRVTIIAFTPLDSGRLAKRAQYESNPKGMRTLEQIANETGRSLAQVALNWITAKPGIITIPKSDHVERVEENCAASGWRLSPDQLHSLDQAFAPSNGDEDD